MAINLSIKGVPDDVAERLRSRAERNHRSLQGELMAIVERAAAEAGDAAAPAEQARAPVGPAATFVQHGTKSFEQIVAEHRARFPKPIKGGPLAVDIIRADRDAR